MTTTKSGIEKLRELIIANAIQVSAGTPDSADVGFFGIVMPPDSTLTALKLKNAIVRAQQGKNEDLDLEQIAAEDISYTRLGIWLGDQGIALALIGLGSLLELWDVVLPTTVGVVDEALYQQMLGMGFVLARVTPDSILRS